MIDLIEMLTNADPYKRCAARLAATDITDEAARWIASEQSRPGTSPDQMLEAWLSLSAQITAVIVALSCASDTQSTEDLISHVETYFVNMLSSRLAQVIKDVHEELATCR